MDSSDSPHTYLQRLSNLYQMKTKQPPLTGDRTKTKVIVQGHFTNISC